MKKPISLIIISIIFSLMLPTGLYANTTSITGESVGNGRYNVGEIIDFSVNGTVYYYLNGATQLNVYSLSLWVYNYGDYDVDQTSFVVPDGQGTKVTGWPASRPMNGIAPDNNRRLEVEWAPECRNYNYDTTFIKNGFNGEKFVYTDMSVACSQGGSLAGLDTIWRPNSKETNFHY